MTHAAHLFPTWIMGGLANAILMADAFRVGIGAPMQEYALELELARPDGDLVLGSWEVWPGTIGHPIVTPLLLPRLSIGDRSEWDDVLNCAYEDLLNAAAVVSAGPKLTFQLH